MSLPRHALATLSDTDAPDSTLSFLRRQESRHRAGEPYPRREHVRGSGVGWTPASAGVTGFA